MAELVSNTLEMSAGNNTVQNGTIVFTDFLVHEILDKTYHGKVVDRMSKKSLVMIIRFL